MKIKQFKSMQAGLINTWYVKISMLNKVYCVVMYNIVNKITYVQYFDMPLYAQLFVERVVTEE